jgi:uncharacterized lipoprotein YddW (UPF0748 family)
MIRKLLTAVALLAVGCAPTAAPPPYVPAAPPEAVPEVQPETPPLYQDELLSLPELPREFRGAWIASVANIDWPSRQGLSVERQQAELRAMLDRAVALRLNAVILQVRPAADAFYASPYEPWSEYLTGVMGRAPDPYYDPLAFAVREAHERGLQLHAWFNPYRARHATGRAAASADHISRTHPQLVRRYGSQLWMDPGERAVQDHTVRVILDVVRRYDIDGVHIDDYFYPYKERNPRGGGYLEFPDAESYARYRARGGTLSRDDWRRDNVDRLIERLYAEIKAEKPHVKFGISPFGIWRPGHPQGIWGLDAYRDIYADARKWLNNGWLDYFAPQLYWPVAQRGQEYPLLLEWWARENTHGRHLWPGNFTSRVSEGRWPASEVVDQIRITREHPGATGNIHFSMRTLMRTVAMIEQLETQAYTATALVPASPWLSSSLPARPVVRLDGDPQRGAVTLVLEHTEPSARWWVVRARYGGEWITEVVPAAQRRHALPRLGSAPEVVAVSVVDRLGIESPVQVLRWPAAPAGATAEAQRRAAVRR